MTLRYILASVIIGLPAVSLDAQPIDERLLEGMEYRAIGPARGGRATTCTGVTGDPLTYYMGATGGGVWKTENAGLSWEPISDDDFKTGSVGAVAVATSDPNVIYVGMGERDPRGNFSHGDGVYKSVDAGETWSHIGLADTRQIGKIRIHPQDHNLVYVAALGHIYGPNEERGVFRSTDGGETWEKILYVDEHTGAIDLAMDPNNPRVLYAGFWQVSRTPWSLDSGGPGSGLYKSVDGGDTWEELSEGLPKGIKGKIGIAVSPVDSDRVYALVEAKDGGVYRSDDAGESWRRVNSDARLRQRAWYYTHIYADTKELNTVYVLNVRFWKSTNGGSDFDQRIRVPHADNHDLWINPDNNRIMVNANDGGANVSMDGGESWTEQDMQPTAQMYHVTVDNQFPYRVYGAQQDNSTISISSQNRIGNWRNDWYSVGGGESGYIAVHPENPDIVYAGSYGGYLTRYDHETEQTRNITVWPDNPMGAGVETMKYRFQWTFPIHISPHDSDTLYVGAHVVLKSTDEGQSWDVISPDLTTDDESRQKSSGGPITQDNTSVEYYCTIFALAESPHEQGVIWAGSDDGLVHITRDGGETWDEVTPAGLGEWSLISQIEISPHDPATCYLAVNRYKMDDFKPYIYVTNNYGKTWRKITHGIADDAFVRAVREDPGRRGLLYAGTETGVWVSFDDGAHWQPLQLNLPHTPITDMVVHEDDLVLATQGRSFWILDDLTPLHQMSGTIAEKDVHLFTPRDACRTSFGDPNITFWLSEEAVENTEIELAFLDEAGEAIRTFEKEENPSAHDEDGEAVDDSAEKDVDNEAVEAGDEDVAPAEAEAESEVQEVPEEDAPEEEEDDEENEEEDILDDLEPGMNTFTWNMRLPDATDVPGAVMWGGGTRGPMVRPGAYQVRLTVGDTVLTESFEINPDPRLDATREEYQAQFDLALKVHEKIDEIHRAINTVRDIRRQIDLTLDRAKGHNAEEELEAAAEAIRERIRTVEKALIQTKSKSRQDPLNYPIKLNDKISGLQRVIERAHGRPTQQTHGVFVELSLKAETYLKQLRDIIDEDIPAFNQLVREKQVPAIRLKPREEDDGDDSDDEDDNGNDDDDSM